MSNILKLIQLDKALIKPYNKYFLIILIAPIVSIYSFKDFTAGIIFCMIMMAMTSNYTFSIAEKNDLNRLYGLLPINKKDIVVGRYLFTAILGLIGVFIAIVLNVAVLTWTKTVFTIDDVLYGFALGMTLYFLFTAVQLPGFFKFGAIKGRFFSFVPLLGLALMGEIVKRSHIEESQSFAIAVLNNPYGMVVCSVLFCIVIYSISIGITQKLYGAMEL